MPRPFSIKVAVQGGGAKLPTLVAALSVLQRLEKNGDFKVTRLAGTSAGAIAAAFYAAPIEMPAVKAHLQGKAQLLMKTYSMPGAAKKAFLATLNVPFWNVTELQKSLTDLLGESKTVSQLAIPLSIVSTDLKNLRKKPAAPGDSLIDSLLNSSAIPMFFRSVAARATDSALIVDGGICANLPSEELVDDGFPGTLIGISFVAKSLPINPTGVISFSQSMINAAIEHSVRRAQAELGENLLLLDTEIDTFDFARGLTEGLSTEYLSCQKQAEEFFAKLRARLELAEMDAESRKEEERRLREEEARRHLAVTEDLRATRADLLAIYDSQEAEKKFQVDSFAMIVTAYSLFEDKRRQSDVIKRVLTFRADTDAIYAHRTATKTDAAEEPLEDDVRVEDRNGNSVPIRVISLERGYSRVNGVDLLSYPMLIYFLRPLIKNDPREPFRLITFERFSGAIANLQSDGNDTLLATVKRAVREIPRVDIVVHIPKAFTNIALSTASFQREDGKWQHSFPGTAIAEGELNLNYSSPDGFAVHGWRGEQVPPAATFGCMIQR